MERRTKLSNDGYETPDSLLELVREVFGGTIYLDPCTNSTNPTGALHFYAGGRDDGLDLPWSGRVFVNPPYGRALPAWVDKVTSAVLQAEMLVLVPARPGSKWYRRLQTNCDRYCELGRRLTFKGAPNPAMFPSAVFYFGSRVDAFDRVFALHGQLLSVG